MSRGDRYEQDRFEDRYYERDREYDRDRDRGGYGRGGGRDIERDRVIEDDRYYMRGGRGGGEVEERDRYYERDVDYDRRRPAYEEPRYADHLARDFERVAVEDRERDYRRPRSDLFDRRPEPGPLVRHSPPPPRSRYEYDERDTYRDSYREPLREPLRDPYRDEFRAPPPPRSDRGAPEHVHEVVRERTIERDRSPAASRARSHHSHSRSRSRSSSRSGGTSVREYPKKGKTRIPTRLVSTKVIIDMGYPYVEEGTTIIIQKALSQQHIDELLRLTEEYKKTEIDITVPAPKSSAGEIIEERREVHRDSHGTHEEIKQEVIISPPPPPQPIYVPVQAPAPPAPAPVSSAPLIVDVHPGHRSSSRGHAHVEVVDKTVVREDYPRYLGGDYGEETLVVGPVVRARSRSRARSSIRADIRALERELEVGTSRRHRHHHHYDEEDYDVVRTERMEGGELVVYEERVERLTSHPKPPRIEKDKKGPHPGLLRAMLTSLT